MKQGNFLRLKNKKLRRSAASSYPSLPVSLQNNAMELNLIEGSLLSGSAAFLQMSVWMAELFIPQYRLCAPCLWAGLSVYDCFLPPLSAWNQSLWEARNTWEQRPDICEKSHRELNTTHERGAGREIKSLRGTSLTSISHFTHSVPVIKSQHPSSLSFTVKALIVVSEFLSVNQLNWFLHRLLNHR